MKNRIGIYSGTFDPIHEGHILFALKAREVCSLDQVLFLPERKPRNKNNVTNYTNRVECAEEAIKSYPGLRIMTLNAAPQTFKKVMKEIPSIFKDNTVIMLVGSDIAKHLYSWKDIDLFLLEHELCIGLRDEVTAASIRTTMNQLEEKIGKKVTYKTVSTTHRHMSSTRMRSSLA